MADDQDFTEPAEEEGGEPLSEDEMGEPVTELRDLSVEPGAGFLDRLIRSLRRRALGRQLTTLVWSGFAEVFLEFLKAIHALLQPDEKGRGE